MDDVKKSNTNNAEINAMLARIAILQNMAKNHGVNNLGLSFDGTRDLYAAVGYSKTVTYQDYIDIYKRLGVAKRVNNAPCNAIWSMPPRVYDLGESKKSAFEIAWDLVVKRLSVWHKFNQLDKLLGFGQYAVLLLGYNDTPNASAFQNELLPGKHELLYIHPYAAEYAGIKSFEEDIQNPRYGKPLLYTLNINADATGAKPQTLTVHHSRILHVFEDAMQNDIYGNPRLENPYNDLQNIEKIIGGSGEMFWRGARPGYNAKMAPDVRFDENDPTLDDMKTQLKQYEDGLRRILYMQGVDMQAMEMQIADPLNHLDVQLQDISAGTQIPKRLLTGSERGELASSMDRDNWKDYIDERRQWFAEPMIVKPFIDNLIANGVLPIPQGDSGEYKIAWPELRDPTPKEKAETGLVRANAIKSYTTSPGAEMIMPLEQFYRLCLGLNDAQIDEAMTWLDDLAIGEQGNNPDGNANDTTPNSSPNGQTI